MAMGRLVPSDARLLPPGAPVDAVSALRGERGGGAWAAPRRSRERAAGGAPQAVARAVQQRGPRRAREGAPERAAGGRAPRGAELRHERQLGLVQGALVVAHALVVVVVVVINVAAVVAGHDVHRVGRGRDRRVLQELAQQRAPAAGLGGLAAAAAAPPGRRLQIGLKSHHCAATGRGKGRGAGLVAVMAASYGQRVLHRVVAPLQLSIE